MEIVLNKEEFVYCLEAGAARYKDGLQVPNKSGYAEAKNRSGQAVMFETMAVMAEVAACKMLGLDYTDPKIYTAFVARVNGKLPAECKKPDIAGIWEIRRVNKPRNPLRLWAKDDNAATVVIKSYVDYKNVDGKIGLTGKVEFLGWVEGTEYSLYNDKYKCYVNPRKDDVAEVYGLNPMNTMPRPVGDEGV